MKLSFPLLLVVVAAVCCLSCPASANSRLDHRESGNKKNHAIFPHRRLRLSSVHTEAANALFPLTVTGGCTSDIILQAVADACNCLAEPFLHALLRLDEEIPQEQKDSKDALHARLGELCATAWQTVETSTWQDIDPMFTDEFMERFVQGETYLNGTYSSCGCCIVG